MSHAKDLSNHALALLRTLPRLSLGNLTHIKGTVKKNKRGRGDHGGKTHGYGKTGAKSHLNYHRVGFESGSVPFYLRFPRQYYYRGHHLKREYPPLSLLSLQKMIELNRLDISKPIDLAAICNTGLYTFRPDHFHFGLQLTDEGVDVFNAKINLEVQWTTEPVIAAIERNGGTITTAFYDTRSLFILKNAKKYFEKGEAIPRRMIPPQDAILFYSSAATRGYLADPEEVSKERVILAHKYGYKLPDIEKDPDYEMLTERKDPRQIFYGLEPGWVINLREKVILKPKDKTLKEFYRS